MYSPPNNYCFIDGSNLHLTYEHLDWKLDYRKLRVYLKKKHQVQVAYYFVGYVLKNSDIYRKLEEYGYQLKHEPTTRRADGGTVGDLDDYIIKEVKWNINKYDRAILISGDHHFASLVKELNDQNKLKLVLAPHKSRCAGSLIKAADTKIAFIDDLKKRLKKEEE
jgi:uncharacterized LabA/DUF88 family protein